MTGSVAVRTSPDPSADATRAESGQMRFDSAHTNRGFDDLSPHERDRFLHEIELDFRRYIAETTPRTGFVIYPNSRKLMQAISTLYETLVGIDFSDMAL